MNSELIFSNVDQIADYIYFESNLGNIGSILGSKSNYANSRSSHVVIFNANLYLDNLKIWFGDIDLSLKVDSLTRLSFMLHQALYLDDLAYLNESKKSLKVLYEMDGRFQHEDNPNLENYVASFDRGIVTINPALESFFEAKILTNEIPTVELSRKEPKEPRA